MSDLKKLRESWRKFAFVSDYPREWGQYVFDQDGKHIYRQTMMTEDIYLGLMESKHLTENCYISTYPSGAMLFDLYHEIFIDIDADTMDEAIKSALAVEERLKMLGLNYSTIFSGGKGFHFHIYLTRTPVAIPNFQYGVRKFLDIGKWVDPTRYGDKAAIMRVVNSINTKTGLFATQVISPNFDMTEAMELHDEYVPADTNDWVVDIIKSYDVEPWESNGGQMVAGNDIEYPLCIIGIMKKAAQAEHLEHHERLHLVFFMDRMLPDIPEKEDQICAMFGGMNDFNMKKTHDQVRSIMGKGYRPYGCKRVKDWQGCPYENQRECGWYFYIWG
jgi:hypothetical protein